MRFLDINQNYLFRFSTGIGSFQKFSKKVSNLLKSKDFNGFIISSCYFAVNKKQLFFSHKEINNLRNKEVCLDIEKKALLLYRYAALEILLRKKNSEVSHKPLIILIHNISSNRHQLTKEWFKDSHKHNVYFWFYESQGEEFFEDNLDGQNSYQSINDLDFNFMCPNYKEKSVLNVDPVTFLEKTTVSERNKSLNLNLEDCIFLIRNNILTRDVDKSNSCFSVVPSNLTKKEDIINFLNQKKYLLGLINEKV